MLSMAPDEARTLITGGSGFVGRHLIENAVLRGRAVRATHRTRVGAPRRGAVEWIDVGDVGMHTNWGAALEGISAVIHLAARAHVLAGRAHDSVSAYRETNTCGSVHLAECAASAGVKRFVFVSSVGVHGRASPGRAISEQDEPQPHDPYTLSKREAELGLLDIGGRTSMQVVIVRPPLVFGPDAPGNFGRLLRAVHRGWPLPFAALDNRRSLINVENLVDFLWLCCGHPHAAGEIFLVADDDDVSTPQLAHHLASGMGRKPRLFYMPESSLRLAGRLAGRTATIESLCGSLLVSTSKARDVLGWRARVPTARGLQQAAHDFVRRRRADPRCSTC